MAVLWIVDRGSPREAFNYLPADNSANLIVYNEANMTSLDLINAVRRRVTTLVNKIRIVSHGNSGQLHFSNGIIDEQRVGVFQFLRGLTLPPVLSGNAGIEVHGCGVASGYLPPPIREQGIGNVYLLNYGNMEGQLTLYSYQSESSAAGAIRSSRGFRFLQRMAQVCEACIKGGIDYQVPDAQWQYEGPTITVCPNPFSRATLIDPKNRLGLGELFRF